MVEQLRPQVSEADHEEEKNPEDFLPLTTLSTYVLLSLVESPKHAYGVLKSVKALSENGKQNVPSIYRSLSTLVNIGLLDSVPCETSSEKGRPGRKDDFVITGLGLEVLELESERLLKLSNSIDKTLTDNIPSHSDIFVLPDMKAENV